MKGMKFLTWYVAIIGTLVLLLNCSGDSEEIIPETPVPDQEPTIISVLVLRSEYEKIGDLIYDINDPQEGTHSYQLEEGNEGQFFTLSSSSGQLKIQNEIPDQFNELDVRELSIRIGNTIYELVIKDGFDYYLENLPSNAVVLDEHNQRTIDANSQWTAFNNLWGRGTAIPNQDFRIATIHYPDLPDGTVLLWDVPSMAADYGGASVWNYNNVFWGNRKNMREDLPGFPFQIEPITNLTLDFEMEQLFGNDQFKIAMNMFMTDESELTNFSNNYGDFFFVFDQKDTFVPNYTHTLPDIELGGKTFAVRYDLNPENGYERRRVIIKDDEQWFSGNLDILALFNMFSAEGFLNTQQYIYHLQFGIEVTSGWGAVQFHELHINYEHN